MQVKRKIWDIPVKDRGYGIDLPYLINCQVVVGIDPGITNTGIATVYSGGSMPVLFSTASVKTKPSSPVGRRLAEVSSALVTEFDNAHRLSKEVYWEGMPGNQGFPTVRAGIERFISRRGSSKALTPAVIGIAQMRLHQAGIEAIEYYPSQIKKIVTGGGNATKGEIREAVLSHVEIPLKENITARAISNHAMDAIAIALCVLWEK